MQPSMFQCSPEWNSMGYNVLRLGHHIIVYMYSSRGVLWYCGTGLVHTGLCTGWFKYKPCTGTPVLILLHLVQFYKIASPSNSQQLTATQRNLWGSHKICNSAQLHATALLMAMVFDLLHWWKIMMRECSRCHAISPLPLNILPRHDVIFVNHESGLYCTIFLQFFFLGTSYVLYVLFFSKADPKLLFLTPCIHATCIAETTFHGLHKSIPKY